MNPFELTTFDPSQGDTDIEVIWTDRCEINGATAGTPDYDVIGRESLVRNKDGYYFFRHSKFSHFETGKGLTLINESIKIPTEIGEILAQHLKQHHSTTKSESEVNLSSRDLLGCVGDIGNLIDQLHNSTAALKDDIIYDLHEIIGCFSSNSNRACLALCGRCLELVLKSRLITEGITFDDNWMVGKLLALYAEKGIYIDPATKNVLNVINTQRIMGVHAKEKTPIPSREQTIMVIYAITDVGKRLLCS